MGWLKKILLYISGESRFITMREAYEGVLAEELLLEPTPTGGWEGYFDYLRFINSRVDILYHACGVNNSHESFTIGLRNHKIGVIEACYSNNKLSRLVLSGRLIYHERLSDESRHYLNQIILRLRKVCAEGGFVGED